MKARLEVLSSDEIRTIHEATLEILFRVDVRPASGYARVGCGPGPREA